jgi:preprotein translocase subunit SecB
MNDEPQAQQPPLIINAQYIKDLSFEVPNAPEIYREQTASPDIPIGLDVGYRQLAPNTFEVTLHMRIESKYGEKTGFILEVAYGCVASINVPQEHVHPVLLIECPRMMFPFIRNIVSDLTRDGGFPPLMLTPVDFLALYQQRMQEQQAAQAQAQTLAQTQPGSDATN